MEALAKALLDLDEPNVLQLAAGMVERGVSTGQIVREMQEGMVAVGERFAAGDYYLTELMFAADIMQSVVQRFEAAPSDTVAEGDNAGLVVIGTVQGDIHDIGKNIVVNLLRSNGFRVVDLGVNVAPETFVEKVRETHTAVLGLSALLNDTYPQMKHVVDALKAAGLREQVKVIIGGTICTEMVREYTDADYFATDAVTGIDVCRRVYEDEA